MEEEKHEDGERVARMERTELGDGEKSECVNDFFFKQKTAYEILSGLVGSGMCIRGRSSTA